MTIFFLLAIIVLLIITNIIFYAGKSNFQNEYLHISKVPKLKGEFAVHPSISSENLTVVSLCSEQGGGQLGNSLCSFSNVKTLQEALDICNRYIVICNNFIYNQEYKTVMFVETPQEWISINKTKLDSYSRQLDYKII